MYKGKGGLQYDLAERPLAAGGEGKIYAINEQPGLVAKLYLPGKASIDKERKLIKMVNEPPGKDVLTQIAWPQDVLYDRLGKFVGFTMPKLNTNEDLNVVYEYGSASKYPNMLWENKIIIAQNLCAVLDSVHIAGHTVGDFNPKNISVDPKTGHIVFLDTDSYHIQDGDVTYRCDVGMPEYLPSEVQVKMRGGGTLASANLPTFTQQSDNFALAIHIFQLLMNGVHPFACAIIPSQDSVTVPQPIDNIERGLFPFIHKTSGFKIPPLAPEINILPNNLQDLFKRAFIGGHHNPNVRPSAEEWHAALGILRSNLKTCGNVSHHQYYKKITTCPWCEADNRYARKFRPKPKLSQTTITVPSYTPPSPTFVAPSLVSSIPATSPSSSSMNGYSIKKLSLVRKVGLIITAITALCVIVTMIVAYANSMFFDLTDFILSIALIKVPFLVIFLARGIIKRIVFSAVAILSHRLILWPIISGNENLDYTTFEIYVYFAMFGLNAISCILAFIFPAHSWSTILNNSDV